MKFSQCKKFSSQLTKYWYLESTSDETRSWWKSSVFDKCMFVFLHLAFSYCFHHRKWTICKGFYYFRLHYALWYRWFIRGLAMWMRWLWTLRLINFQDNAWFNNRTYSMVHSKKHLKNSGEDFKQSHTSEEHIFGYWRYFRVEYVKFQEFTKQNALMSFGLVTSILGKLLQLFPGFLQKCSKNVRLKRSPADKRMSNDTSPIETIATKVWEHQSINKQPAWIKFLKLISWNLSQNVAMTKSPETRGELIQ